jgi:hypothetical protein
MDKRIAMLIAAGLSLAVVPSANAQFALSWVDPPPAPDKRVGADQSRVVTYDFVYPPEYQKLGGNGVMLIEALTNDPRELPIKRVVLRFGRTDVVLQPVADRLSTVPTAWSRGRDDAFFLLPTNLPGKTADLWVYFTGGDFHRTKDLAFRPPKDPLNPVAEPPGPPDEAVLKAVLAKQYPRLVKP